MYILYGVAFIVGLAIFSVGVGVLLGLLETWCEKRRKKVK